jgi:hypothetical protein
MSCFATSPVAPRGSSHRGATFVLLLVTALAGSGRGASADPLFAAPMAFETGATPYFVAIGDLNADGKPDLAVANYGSNTVSVLLGNGDGTFGTMTEYGAGNGSISVAIGDLNGDGKPDLATANRGSNTASVLLGNGDGTFGTMTDYGAGSGPFSVVIGDLNGDGKLDLAVANQFAKTVSVLPGNGDGTFEPCTDYVTGSSAISMAIGDLNTDGSPDLVVADVSQSMVSVLLNDGSGAFGASADYATGPGWGGGLTLAIGDLNGDGKPDLAATNVANTYANTVSVLLNNGDGTFGTNTDYDTGSQSYSVAIGDLDADGKPDLAVGNTNSNSITVLFGNGDGTFSGTTDFDAGGRPLSVSIRDLDADCRPDLVVANQFSNTVSVLLNLGTGTIDVGPSRADHPRTFELLASRPNPSRGSSEIRFRLPTESMVAVDLFDLAGRKVRSLASDRLSTPGEHSIRWDGHDASGAPVRDGVYLVQVRAGRDVSVRRLIVLR